MKPNSVVHAATVDLEHEPVPAEQSVRGEPTTGANAIDEFGGLEVGVWEMTPGVTNDVETEQVFVCSRGPPPSNSPPAAPLCTWDPLAWYGSPQTRRRCGR
jgi:hypothetical protein